MSNNEGIGVKVTVTIVIKDVTHELTIEEAKQLRNLLTYSIGERDLVLTPPPYNPWTIAPHQISPFYVTTNNDNVVEDGKK